MTQCACGQSNGTIGSGKESGIHVLRSFCFVPFLRTFVCGFVGEMTCCSWGSCRDTITPLQKKCWCPTITR